MTVSDFPVEVSIFSTKYIDKFGSAVSLRWSFLMDVVQVQVINFICKRRLMFAYCFNEFVIFIRVCHSSLRGPLLALILAGGIDKNRR